MACASRHARNRLSARPCKRITTVSWAHACGTSIQRKSTDASVLDIDQHPTTGEHGERAGSLQQHDLERAEQVRSEEHTSELQSQFHLVCRLLLEKKKK